MTERRKEKTYRYSRLFKEEVLSEIQKENLTVSQAAKYYNITKPIIYYWLKREKIPNPKKEVIFVSIKGKNEILNEVEKLKEENRQLKDLVSKLSLDKLCLETIIDVAKSELNLDLKKNFSTPVLNKSSKKK